MLWVTPFIRSPFDMVMGGDLNVKTYRGVCSQFQLAAVECLEAYGLTRGKKECEPYMHDFMQCQFQILQYQRIIEMIDERDRQIKSGKLTKANAYSSDPPMHTMAFN